MESGAVAMVANRLQVPVLILRGISDLAIHPDNSLAFETYLGMAATMSAHLCLKLIASLV